MPALYGVYSVATTPDDAEHAQVARREIESRRKWGIKAFDEYETLWRSPSLLIRQCVVDGGRHS